MLKITMYSSADKVKGQGVGSAYLELIGLLERRLKAEFDVKINQLRKSDISHYHTVDFQYYLSTFLPGRGRKIGYVHFLPETLEGSIKLPQPFRSIFYHYVIAFYRRMDQIVVVNPNFIAQLEAYGIPRGKITYIPNFVTKDEFYEMSQTEKLAARSEAGIQPARFTILGIGQIQDRKGVPDFIQLAKDNPDIQFVWAGGFSFGKITDGYKQLKAVVDDPPANLIFPGIVNRDELVKWYNIADLFLLPSFNELFPMSVLEAFSCGVPVLLRDLPLYRSIIDGYYEAASDEPMMQAKIRTLSSSPAAMKFLHDQSLIASEEYSEARLAETWREFYQQQAEER